MNHRQILESLKAGLTCLQTNMDYILLLAVLHGTAYAALSLGQLGFTVTLAVLIVPTLLFVDVLHGRKGENRLHRVISESSRVSTYAGILLLLAGLPVLLFIRPEMMLGGSPIQALMPAAQQQALLEVYVWLLMVVLVLTYRAMFSVAQGTGMLTATVDSVKKTFSRPIDTMVATVLGFGTTYLFLLLALAPFLLVSTPVQQVQGIGIPAAMFAGLFGAAAGTIISAGVVGTYLEDT